MAENSGPFQVVDSLVSAKPGKFVWRDTLDFNADIHYRINAISGYRSNRCEIQNGEIRIPWMSTWIDKSNLSVLNFSLSQNYPNPFNPTTTISFSISKNGPVRLQIFNQAGQQIVELINEYKTAGQYQSNWNAGKFPSGIYFYRLESENSVQTKKMTFMK
jgi:hypothetical protein